MIVSSSRWLRLWDKVTEPATALLSPDERRKSRTLASLVLILIPIILIDALSAYAVGTSLTGFAIAIPALALAYVLSRKRRYRLGGVLALFALYMLAGITLLLSDRAADSFYFILKYPLINIVVTHLLFPRRVYIILILTFAGAVFTSTQTDRLNVIGVLSLMDLLLTSLAIVCVLIFMRRDDLEDRRQAEALIIESEERYRMLSNVMSDYAYAVRIEPHGSAVTEWMAGAVEAITGYTIDEARQMGLPNLIYRDDIPMFMQRLENMTEGAANVYEYRIVRKDGQHRWLRDYSYSVMDERKNRIIAYYGAAQDITERKIADEALRESEARFRAIAEGNIIGIIITRIADSMIVYCNPQTAAMLETTPDQLIGKSADILNLDPTFNEKIRNEVNKSISVYNFEQSRVYPSGEERWFSLSLKEIMLGGEPMRLAAVSDITERKKAEIALERSRAQYEMLVNSIDGIVWEINVLTHETTFISRQVESLLGYPVEQFYADSTFWRRRVHPDDVLDAIKTSEFAVHAKRPFQQEYRMIAADGHIIWIQETVSVVSEVDGLLLQRGLAVNITASKEAQAAEQEQRRLTDALRNTAAAISTSLDLNEVLDRILMQLSMVAPVTSVDIMLIENGMARVVRSMGYGSEEGQVHDFTFDVQQTPNMRQMVETGQPFNIADIRAYNEWVQIEPAGWIRSMIGAPIRLEWQTIGFLNMNADVPNAFTDEHALRLQAFTDQVAIAIRNARLYDKVRRYAEELESLVDERTAELNVERQRIQFILDATGEGVFYSEGMQLRYANTVICRLLGYTQQELIGQSIRIMAHNRSTRVEKSWLSAILNQVRNDTIWRGELQLLRKDGTTFDAGLTISIVGDPREKPLRTVTIVRDISKEKALQAQKSRLVAHASHELRTPITNLKTRLYLLQRRPENLDYHIGILEEVTERMKRLVEDLLDVSRLERGVIPLNRERLEVQPLVERIVQIQLPEAEKKQQELRFSSFSSPLFVYADAERLIQVVTNLVTNAINYTPEGGSIQVSVEIENSGKWVLIRVIDTGVGITPDNLVHIFQPFFRVVSVVEGTGLGLSIAKEIIEMHDGSIDVESHFGTGSTFTVRLRLVQQPLALNAH